MKFRTLVDLFSFAGATTEEPDAAAFLGAADVVAKTVRAHDACTSVFSKRGSGPDRRFSETTFPELFEKAGNLAAALAELGVRPGDRVGLFADNREEWLLADMAVIRNGALDVPRGTDSTAEEIRYIVDHSGSRIAFVEDPAVFGRVRETLEQSAVETVVLMEGTTARTESGSLRTLPLAQLLGRPSAGAEAEVSQRSSRVGPADPFTIIYTSGTTGRPKGVELTHANMIYNVNEVPSMIGVQKGERCLSLLPIWHVFERALEYCILPFGAKLYYTNTRDLRGDFEQAKPTFMASAPRLWESIYDGIMNKMENSKELERQIFRTALSINRRLHRSVSFLRGNELGALPEENVGRQAVEAARSARDFLPAKVLDRIVFHKIRAALGGHLRGTISGGGALPAHVDEFFNAIGIPVYEGYGMTECSPIISVRKRGRVVQGSVGFTPPGTEVRIVGEQGRNAAVEELGVIHVRGPQVMKGYYLDAQATALVLSDGWLNTGDLGFISRNGTLSIRGRAKDTIVLLGGENVEPEPIENCLRQSPYVEQVMIVGQDRKSLGALIRPNLELLQREGLLPGDKPKAPAADLNEDAALRLRFAKIIKEQVNADSGFKSFERITGFAFLPRPFEVGRELTNLYKLRRNAIAEEYAMLIDGIYAGTKAKTDATRM